MDPLEWVRAVALTRLHLAERERLAVVGNDVELPEPGPVAALNDPKTTALQVLGCQALTETSKVPARI